MTAPGLTAAPKPVPAAVAQPSPPTLGAPVAELTPSPQPTPCPHQQPSPPQAADRTTRPGHPHRSAGRPDPAPRTIEHLAPWDQGRTALDQQQLAATSSACNSSPASSTRPRRHHRHHRRPPVAASTPLALLHSDDRSRPRRQILDLKVLDASSGRKRRTDALSGGETSTYLALALGLTDIVTAGAGSGPGAGHPLHRRRLRHPRRRHLHPSPSSPWFPGPRLADQDRQPHPRRLAAASPRRCAFPSASTASPSRTWSSG